MTGNNHRDGAQLTLAAEREDLAFHLMISRRLRRQAMRPRSRTSAETDSNARGAARREPEPRHPVT